ncbi:MAG: hypothetical protein ACREMY_02705, partial [bacterium]
VLGGSAFGVACKSKKKGTSTSTPKSTASASTPSSNGGTTPAATSGSSGNNGSSSLSDLADNLKDKEGKVSYTFTSTAADGTQTGGTFVIYLKPGVGSRFDFDDGTGSTGSFITNSDGTYICSSDVCFSSPTGTDVNPFIGLFTDPQTLLNEVGDVANVDHSSKTVAGQDADCYSASNDQGAGELCFSHSGLLLSIKGTDADGTGIDFVATSADNSVSDSDFDLPYPVQSIPGL